MYSDTPYEGEFKNVTATFDIDPLSPSNCKFEVNIPIADIFTFEGPSRLALITCGGEFDRSIGSYLENYVVTAVPAMSIPNASGLVAAPVPSPLN
jgi:hypothetical protein